MLTETWKGMVSPAQCDVLEHMNLQYYFAAIGDAMFCFQIELGLGPSAIHDRHMSFAVVHAESSFKTELVAGDVIMVQSGVEKIGDKSATFYHELVKVEDRSVAFDVHFKCVLLDLDTRKAMAIPDNVREAARKFLIDPAKLKG